MSITYWWSKDRKWFCILADDGACKSTVSLTQKEARDLGAALSPKIATAETGPGDVLAMKEACIRICLEEAAEWDSDNVQTLKNYAGQCANRIDLLDVKAEAKSQEPEAVAIKPLEWVEPCGMFAAFNHTGIGVQYKIEEGDGSFGLRIEEANPSFTKLGCYRTEAEAKAAAQADYEQRIRSALTHPTTKPEAPAVSVDAILTRLNSIAPAVENLACNQEQADMDGCMVKVSRQALDETLEAVNAVAALIAGGR